MNAQPLACPPFEQLRAFGLGHKLEPEADASITEHLQACETCANAVAAISGDDFLARRRAAEESQGTPAPDGSFGGLAKSLTRAADSKLSAEPAADIPPELANHPNYEVIRELGRGGMGVVYLVKNRLMDRLEALKVMATGLSVRSGAADRFQQEIRSAAQLTHQYIVQAHAADQVGDLLMLSMEFVPDGDLGTLVQAKGPLPVVNACYYIWQVAIALQHAHEKGMVHRDIKPSNLILLKSGKRHTVKVTDFGLAKARKDNGDAAGLTSAGQMMGTPHYMSPEQARDAAQVDIRADIYSLGCTLYYLLTGRTPFSGGPMEVLWKHREEEPRPVTELRPQVPAEVAAVVAKMMAKDPADRYQTPAEVARALSPHLKRGPRTEQPQAEVPTARPGMTEAGSVVAIPLPPDQQDQWGDLTFSDAAAAQTAGPTLIPQRRRRRPLWLWPAAVAGGLLIGLLAAWGAGVFKVKTKDGTIVLENLPDDAQVVVDGEVVTVTRNGEEATVTVNRKGPHKLKVVQEGTEIFANDVSVALGGDPVRIRIEPALAKGQEQIPQAAEARPAPQYGVELIRNPGCEEPLVNGLIPEWEVRFGRWQPQVGRARTGLACFYPTNSKPVGVLTQRVDVSRYAAAIDEERQWFAFSGYVLSYKQGGRGDVDDTSRIKIEFLSASDETLSGGFDSGQKAPTSGWEQVSTTLSPPKGTRAIRIFLMSTKGRGFGTSSNDGRYDDLSLKALPPEPPKAADGFVPLFNKKDLTGWVQYDPHNPIWSVRDGLLTLRGRGLDVSRQIATTRTDFGNFYLRMRVKHEDGICFLNVRHAQGAYRFLIGSTQDGPLPKMGRGSIDRAPALDAPRKHEFETLAVRSFVRLGEWYTLEVIAENDMIRTLINGEQVAELKDARGALPPGRISLGGGAKAAMQIESIEIKELGPDGKNLTAPPPVAK